MSESLRAASTGGGSDGGGLRPFEAIGVGFRLLRDFTPFALVYGLVHVLVYSPFHATTMRPFVSVLLMPPLVAGGAHFALRVLRGRPAGFDSLVAGFGRWLALFVPSLCVTLASEGAQLLGPLWPFAWALAFLLEIRLVFAMWVALEDNAPGPFVCLRRSWTLTRGSGLRVGALLLLSIAALVGGALAFGVGLIVALPIVVFAQTRAYLQLLPRS